MHLVDFQAQSHLPKIILNRFCFMTVNVQMYYKTEQNAVGRCLRKQVRKRLFCLTYCIKPFKIIVLYFRTMKTK